METISVHDIATSNCYHFAGSIVKVLEQEFEIQNTVKNSKAGKWYNIDIVSMKEWNIASIRERYSGSQNRPNVWLFWIDGLGMD